MQVEKLSLESMEFDNFECNLIWLMSYLQAVDTFSYLVSFLNHHLYGFSVNLLFVVKENGASRIHLLRRDLSSTPIRCLLEKTGDWLSTEAKQVKNRFHLIPLFFFYVKSFMVVLS